MTTAAVNYAKALWELAVPQKAAEETALLFRENPRLKECLENPLVSFEAKTRVIDRLVPEEMRNFVKVVCRHRKADSLEEIFQAYQELCRKGERTLDAELVCVTSPSTKQLEGIREFLCREFQVQKAEIRIRKDKRLIGGFILRAGGREYDWSLQGRCRRLEQKLTRR